MNPIITVIITAYNVEKYIGTAIEHIQGQTYENIEILIVNDGSVDNTKEISEQYALSDPRIRIINKQNEGLAAARKTGALNARGKYIGFVDADDIIESDMYEVLLTNAINNDADISHCGYTMILSNGECKEYYGTGVLVQQDHEKGLVDLLEGKYIEPSVCNKLYKRELFSQIEYYTDVRILEDLLLNYSLFSQSKKSVFQDVCKYKYCRRDDSMCKVFSFDQITDPVKVKERILEKSLKESKTIQSIAKSRLVSQYISGCFEIRVNNYQSCYTVFEEYRKKIKINYKTCSLSKNDRIKARLIIYAPWLCKIADKAYRSTRRQ